jgi:hypothetical protein
MHDLPRRCRWFIGAVLAAGVVVLAQALASSAGGWPLLPAAGFIALSALADIKELTLSFDAAYSAATAINFAAVIIFGPPVAVWTGAVASVIGDAWRRKPPLKVAFNAAAVAISTAAGGALFEATRRSPRGSITPDDLPALAAYAGAHLLVNHSLVSLVIALATGTRPWEVAAANYRGLFVPIVAMYPLGILMAVTYFHFGGVLGLPLLVVPTLAVYSALNRSQQLRGYTRATLEALADAIDQRDHYTAEHSRRVAYYADRIAAVLGLSIAERDVLISAARVHDLGKISTPDTVLRKAAALDDREWRIMCLHPSTGAAILERLPMYRQGARLVELHHERLDGRGYPHRLSGDAVPLGARILAVADAFDAMTSDRPYRRAMPVEEAVQRLRAGAGTQFCPRVVQAFIEVLQLDQAAAVRPTGAAAAARLAMEGQS